MVMKKWTKVVITIFFLLTFNSVISACPWCRAQVSIETYNQDFFSNLFLLLLPVFILAAIGFGLYHFDKISNKIRGLK
jgi:hypothetical protein